MKRAFNFENLANLVKGYVIIENLTKELRAKMENEYKDIYSNAFIHLMFIKHVDGISQMELCEFTGTNKSTMVRNVKELLDNEYVIKQTSPRANENELYLTEKGKQVVEEIEKWVFDKEKELDPESKNKEYISQLLIKILNDYIVK
ncbi:hypothetical protein SHELI_v1c03450 [Spiroplasma helicoides]|uniref:HTH marR-type domain-containing protein n=1 Tax=Spiroplasma helicoides TaxID=216938 RepID=A0A1B3SK45_9MOLU|nr:MarR family winged helix-turn-helix transcriptional regulator [Spiroplasma helicoides]AOG60300.1 hypothetical protein SHELI_v1c03450 [Spiroplasma helicoides]